MVNDRFAVAITDAGANRNAKLISTEATPIENDCTKKIGFLIYDKGFSFATKYAMKKR